MSATTALKQKLDVFSQMALDEALLGFAPPDAFFLRFYCWTGPAVTFGYSQKKSEADEIARRQTHFQGNASSWPMTRRLTGGGVVFHKEDLTFSIVFPWDRLCSPGFVYKNIHRAVHLGLKSFGRETRILSLSGEQNSAPRPDCFAHPSSMDLILASGAKILGGALRKRGGKGLYQGSLHPRALKLDPPAAQQAVARGLELEWGRRPSQDIPESVFESAEALKEKYKSEKWNYRR